MLLFNRDNHLNNLQRGRFRWTIKPKHIDTPIHSILKSERKNKYEKTIKVLCLIFTFVCMLSTTSVAFASTENVGLTDSPSYLSDGGISTYDGKKPTDVWIFFTKGSYSFNGDTCGNTLYTLYKFIYTRSMTIEVTNNSSSDLRVTVMVCMSFFDDKVDWRVLGPGDKLKFTVPNLDYTKEYYVRFEGGGKVYGTISQ